MKDALLPPVQQVPPTTCTSVDLAKNPVLIQLPGGSPCPGADETTTTSVEVSTSTSSLPPPEEPTTVEQVAITLPPTGLGYDMESALEIIGFFILSGIIAVVATRQARRDEKQL